MADCGVYESLILEAIDGPLRLPGSNNCGRTWQPAPAAGEFQAIQTELENLLAREIIEPVAPRDLERRLSHEIARDRWRARLEALFTILDQWRPWPSSSCWAAG